MIFHKETDFQETEIGRIPSEWEAKRISQICKVRRGASPRPIGDPSYFSETGRGWVRIVDVTSSYKYLRSTSQYLSPKGESKSVKVETGDLVMSICATIGRPIIIDIPACIHDGFVWFSQLTRDVSTEFLFYVLQNKERDFVRRRQTGTQGNLNTTIVGRTSIAIPPFGEQENIVRVLSTVDEAIFKTNEILAKTERLKKGLMQRLLTRGIGHKEFKDTEIGRIPKEWEVDALPDLFNIIDYRGRTPPFSESGVPYIGSDNIRNERIVLDNKRYVSEETYDKYMTRGIPNGGDILFTTEAPLGEVAIIPRNFRFCFAQRLVALQCKGAHNSKFLMYMLRSNVVQKQLDGWATGTTVEGISAKNMKFVKIPYSEDSDEQGKIAEILSTVDKKLELERNEKAKLERIKQGLMDLLLTGKIRIRGD